MQRTDRQRAYRKRLSMIVLVMLGLAGLLGAAESAIQQNSGRAADPDAPGSVNHPRICAAVAAYTLATGDYWDQRAAIAQATLNRFDALGYVPDCSRELSRILTVGIDPYFWQSSLDAVDAIQSGSYDLPLACVRADTISRIPPVELLALAPLRAPAARTPCVIDDLEFMEVL